MSTCLTAEQAFKDQQPKLLRNAVLLALVVHAVAFVLTPTLSVEPYRLPPEEPPVLRPMSFILEEPRPKDEIRKPRRQTEFRPVDEGDVEETIDPTDFDAKDEFFPVEDDAERDTFVVFDDPPRPIVQTEPVYPDLARQAELEGTVGLMIVIDKRGNVERADVVISVPGLDEAAVKAVLKWKFEPARQRDVPVRVKVFQSVRFRLRG